MRLVSTVTSVRIALARHVADLVEQVVDLVLDRADDRPAGR
jgi:hypothetical protein